MSSPLTKGTVLVCIMLSLTTLASAKERLLSRNATYSITDGGYVYTGQIQPGMNERAKKVGQVVGGPLVELTDSGDALIDGDGSDDSKIHTPWIWRQPNKYIYVEMTLPGKSKVSRVRVQFPKDLNYRPEWVQLYAKDLSGQWQDLGRKLVHFDGGGPLEQSPRSVTFELDGRSCRDLKFDVKGVLRHVGVTEIEVWGQGPTKSARRGLVRQRPHIQEIIRPRAQVAKGSVKLSKSASITFDSNHPLTAGKPAGLINGNRAAGIRIDGPSQQHYEVTAELDLGDTYLIDAVHIWMPGGKGAENGHVHEVKLAISPSADHVDWETPVRPLVSAYWPMDDAPRPYVIPVNKLSIPGRRVRVHAYLSGTGGVTSVLALGEIEVWGRRLKKAPPPSARLDLRPVHIEPEAVGQLSPKWEQLRRRRIRGIWIAGSLDEPFGKTGKNKGQVLSEAGFNTVVIYTGVDLQNRSTAPKLEDRIRRNVAEAHKGGMLLLAMWKFGSTHEEPYRRFRGANGLLHELSCCPLGDYIERHVGRWAVAAARLGADG
ncbi:MAG: hypothetical protein V3R81_15825, partial [Gammaproteobacteria bacterium]